MAQSNTSERIRGEAIRGLSSLPEMFSRTVRSQGAKPALGYKAAGGWRKISYERMYERVRNLSAGLAGLGIGCGDAVALMSGSRPEWPIVDLAAQSLGAVTVPVYPTLGEGKTAHILEDCGAKIAVVENGGLLERVEAVRARTPALESLVVVEPEGAEDARSLEEVERDGAAAPLDGWEDGWLAIGRDEVSTVIYTSGTTGPPKGAVLTHGNLLSNLEGILGTLPLYADDVMLSLLPLSHVFERTAGHYLGLSAGCTIYYAESIEKVPQNLREVRPTICISVPRLYEKMYDRVLQGAAQAGGLKKRMFDDAAASGRRAYEIECDGGTLGPTLRLKLALYDRLVFGKLREAVGGRLKFFVSGGARLNPEIGKLFYAAGVKIVEGYGLTETSPVISCNSLERIRFGTVGPPLGNLEVNTDDHGEVLVKGPSVMRGYLGDEEATAEAFTEDGFYRTGDVGEFDAAGYLRITDRAKNLIVLSTGKNVAPQPVETALVAAPHIMQAVLVGDGRKYVSILIVPDYEAVRRSLGCRESDGELAADERTRGLIHADIEAATAGLASYERPKRFALLERELSQEAGELTPTLKLKLGTVRERYAGVVEGLYE